MMMMMFDDNDDGVWNSKVWRVSKLGTQCKEVVIRLRLVKLNWLLVVQSFLRSIKEVGVFVSPLVHVCQSIIGNSRNFREVCPTTGRYPCGERNYNIKVFWTSLSLISFKWFFLCCIEFWTICCYILLSLVSFMDSGLLPIAVEHFPR